MEVVVPYPFEQYHKEPWFPKDASNHGYKIPVVVSDLCDKLAHVNVVQMMKVLQCIVKGKSVVVYCLSRGTRFFLLAMVFFGPGSNVA